MAIHKWSKKIHRIALAGIVMTQDKKMPRIKLKLSENNPRVNPTPRTDPTIACVVEMGSPNFDAKRMVIEAPNSAENPRVGVRVVMFVPIVSITLHPCVKRPITMLIPPKSNKNGGMEKEAFENNCSGFVMAVNTAETGPMALATSLAP